MCAWRTPPTPGEVRMHSTIRRVPRLDEQHVSGGDERHHDVRLRRIDRNHVRPHRVGARPLEAERRGVVAEVDALGVVRARALAPLEIVAVPDVQGAAIRLARRVRLIDRPHLGTWPSPLVGTVMPTASAMAMASPVPQPTIQRFLMAPFSLQRVSETSPETTPRPPDVTACRCRRSRRRQCRRPASSAARRARCWCPPGCRPR